MARLEVLKTYKIYIGGKFPRTESGRYYTPLNSKGNIIGNICLSSRKDVRNAVVAARAAFGGWSERPAFNRSQILYRVAEMLEGRKSQFIEELLLQGAKKNHAEKEIDVAIDRLIYYAGWCDKYNQVLGSVNPVASSHFNFSVNEPMAEVLNSSDVPGGVVNVLTGNTEELLKPLVEHMDVNAVAYSGDDSKQVKFLEECSALNMKRIRSYNDNWMNVDSQDLYKISDFQEVKTTWHPIENIGGATSSY
jgi:acyl-CoA reductase-like NAD-dependent aldehyde dehydrogenase